jgi:hypothetical protein
MFKLTNDYMYIWITKRYKMFTIYIIIIVPQMDQPQHNNRTHIALYFQWLILSLYSRLSKLRTGPELLLTQVVHLIEGFSEQLYPRNPSAQNKYWLEQHLEIIFRVIRTVRKNPNRPGTSPHIRSPGTESCVHCAVLGCFVARPCRCLGVRQQAHSGRKYICRPPGHVACIKLSSWLNLASQHQNKVKSWN